MVGFSLQIRGNFDLYGDYGLCLRLTLSSFGYAVAQAMLATFCKSNKNESEL